MRLPTISPRGRAHDVRYNRILQRDYPDCRMRWSERRESWLLERRATYARLDINPSKYPSEAIDTFIRHRDGYYLAGEYGPRSLPDPHFLVVYLQANDPARMDLGGGSDVERAARLAQMFEDREAAQQTKAWKDQSFYESGAGSELYDRLAWDEGRRVTVPRVFDSKSGSQYPGGFLPRLVRDGKEVEM